MGEPDGGLGELSSIFVIDSSIEASALNFALSDRYSPKAPNPLIIAGVAKLFLEPHIVIPFGCGYFRTTVQEGYNRRWS
jgi:hypothetical protein